ncbi:MAG TPA: hypothetical protein DHW10_02020 [Rhodospirillaceae bacterium]|nr:hypothetical protein [Rhodospirillaceae bacterium]
MRIESVVNMGPQQREWIHLNIDVTVETADPRFNQAVKDAGSNVGQADLDHLSNNLDQLAENIAVFTNKTRDALSPVWVFSDYDAYKDVFPEAAHLFEEQGRPHKVERGDNDDVIRKTEPNAVPDNVEYFERLKGQGIKGVVITGLYADICVLETAQSLLDEGFQVMVVEDLVDTNLEETRAEGMQKLKDSGARMVSETQVMDALGHGQLNELHRGSFTIEESTQRNAGNTKSAQCISYLRL